MAAILLPAGAAGGEHSSPLELKHADRLITAGENGEIVNLVGNVHLSHEGADIYSQRATWYRKSGLVQFVDSVVVLDGSRRITARNVTYYRRNKRVTATGEVRIEDPEEDVVLTCQKADYFRKIKEFVATGHPLLVLNPYDGSTRTEIRSLTMDYFAREKRGVAYDSVEIKRRDMIATAGHAEFFNKPEHAVLTQRPRVLRGEDTASGDTISIFSNQRKLERVLVEGNAEAFYKTQPDTSVQEFTTATLTGKELEVFFTGDKPAKAVMRFNATSVYIPAVTDTITRGTNTASGDSITLYFDEGGVSRVLISGGAQGEYIEAKLDEEGRTVVDTTHYSARQIDYRLALSEIQLLSNAILRYHDITLSAGDIRYDTKTRILLAQPMVGDTADELIQPPTLKQGKDEIDGLKMTYNLDTRKGQVRMARTRYEGGYYTGQVIRQVAEDVLFVSEGNYTSCDLEESPHYHFHSNRMKMVSKDKVIAKPVILYVGELPVFALPYYVFPIRKGRHSGFLTFEVGNFERGERFIRNLGYYWAASQYWDLETSLDFYENVRTILNGNVRYSLRYRMRGHLEVNFARESGWTDFRKRVNARWRLSFSHNQTITPTTKLAASGSFVSDKNYIADNIFDPDERLDRTIRSQANLTKRWRQASVVVSAEQSWNLDTDVKRELLPSISFSRSSLPLFPEPSAGKVKIRRRPGEEAEETKKRFYHSIYFSIRTTARNSRQRIRRPDSTFYWKNFQTIHTQSSITSPQKLLGFLTVNPGVSVTQTIYNLQRNDVVDSLGLRANRFFTRETYSLNVQMKTSLYGTVYPNTFGLLGVRHVMTPTVNYRFSPEIKKSQAYLSYTGVGAASKRSKTVSYSLSNVFQAKYKSGESERKVDLFTLNFSGGYNFAAEQRKLSNLSTRLRTTAIPHIDVDLSSSHSFYNDDDTRRSLWKPRLTNLSVNTTIKARYYPGGDASGGDDGGSQGEWGKQRRLFGRGAAKRGGFSDVGFELTLSHRYSESRLSGNISKRQWVDLGLQLQPTQNWMISYDCRYGMEDKLITAQTLSIKRNMHCWEGAFVWIPTGPIAGYYVRINIKALPDVKVEKSEGGVRGRYY